MMKIKSDTKMSVKLPQIVEADDYHEFKYIQDVLAVINPKIRVTEVGFGETKYVGLIHANTRAHKNLIKQLTAELEDNDE